MCVHLRISCLEISVFFDFLEFNILLLSLLVFFSNYLKLFFLDLVLLRLVVFKIRFVM